MKLEFPAELVPELAGNAGTPAAESGSASTQAAGDAVPAAAAGAPAGSVGQQPSGTPDTRELPPQALKAMADRRKAQLAERDTTIARLTAERDQLVAFRQGTEAELVPTLTRTYQDNQRLQQELWRERQEREKRDELLRRLKAEHQIEKDPDISDWERDAARRRQEAERDRKLDYLLHQRTTAAQVAAPNSDEESRRQASMAHFSQEMATIKRDNPEIATGLAKHEQDILNRWWQTGGSRPVGAIAQDTLDDLRETFMLQMEVKRSKNAGLPAVSGPGGTPAPAAGGATLPAHRGATGPMTNADGTWRDTDSVVAQKIASLRARP